MNYNKEAIFDTDEIHELLRSLHIANHDKDVRSVEMIDKLHDKLMNYFAAEPFANQKKQELKLAFLQSATLEILFYIHKTNLTFARYPADSLSDIFHYSTKMADGLFEEIYKTVYP